MKMCVTSNYRMPKAGGVFPYPTLMHQGKLPFVESPGPLMDHLHSWGLASESYPKSIRFYGYECHQVWMQRV